MQETKAIWLEARNIYDFILSKSKQVLLSVVGLLLLPGRARKEASINVWRHYRVKGADSECTCFFLKWKNITPVWRGRAWKCAIHGKYVRYSSKLVASTIVNESTHPIRHQHEKFNTNRFKSTASESILTESFTFSASKNKRVWFIQHNKIQNAIEMRKAIICQTIYQDSIKMDLFFVSNRNKSEISSEVESSNGIALTL